MPKANAKGGTSAALDTSSNRDDVHIVRKMVTPNRTAGPRNANRINLTTQPTVHKSNSRI